MLMSPYSADIAQIAADERVPVVTTGAGNPTKYMKLWADAGVKVIPVVPSAGLAKMTQRGGATAVIAEGCESGGHIGELTTMALIPQVCDAVDIPVIAAGGIGDGRGIAAAFMLGAVGVQLGTRFLIAKECGIHPVLGDAIYGREKPELGMSSQCLHARKLCFSHPSTNEHIELSTELPDYFNDVLLKLEKREGSGVTNAYQ